jgi:hypothetical protein
MILKRHPLRSLLFTSLGLAFCCIFTVPSTCGAGKDLSFETPEIQEAAQKYLAAEVQRNFKVVYESLAPSSEYVATHTFNHYLTEAQTSPVRIVSYRIIHIFEIADNPDKGKYPKIDRSARVEVDMVIRYVDTQKESEVNYAFPFVKEGGKWYKL